MSKRKKHKHTAATPTLTQEQRDTLATAQAAREVFLPQHKTEPKLKSNKADASKVKPKKAATKSKQTKKSTVKAKKKPSLSDAVKKVAKAKKITKKKPAKQILKADPHLKDAKPAFEITYRHGADWFDGGLYADRDSAILRFNRLRRSLYKEDYANLRDLETHAAVNGHGLLDTNDSIVEDIPPGEAVTFPDSKQKYEKYKGGNGRNLPAIIAAEGVDYSKAQADDSGPQYKDNSAEYND